MKKLAIYSLFCLMLFSCNKNDDNKIASALRKIKSMEKTRKEHGQIESTLGLRQGSYLVKIEVLIELDGDTVGWKMLRTKIRFMTLLLNRT